MVVGQTAPSANMEGTSPFDIAKERVIHHNWRLGDLMTSVCHLVRQLVYDRYEVLASTDTLYTSNVIIGEIWAHTPP